jgi:hypothetical protein
MRGSGITTSSLTLNALVWREIAALRELLDDDRLALADGNRRLARLLREGAGDPGQSRRDALFAHLRAVGHWRLAESNPKALSAASR